jgi:glycosyltransferase involved in cell wall biosynthesis
VKISFVIPTYNSAEFLHPAVESCLTQTYKDIEVVVVDDCSTDSTHDYLAWLEAQKHENVKIVRNPTNCGRSASRNIGNAAASGDILAVLDADDISAPRRAELTVAKFKAGAEFVHGGAYLMGVTGTDLGMVETDVFNRDKAADNLSAGIVHSTVAYSRALAARYPYLEGEPARLGVDDFTIFLPMAFDGVRFVFIPAPLAAYRQNENGIMAKRDNAEVIEFKRGFLKAYEKVAA